MRVYIDTAGRDRRSCGPAWTDSTNGVYRYRFGCYGPADRSTVDGSLLMGSPRSFVCEEVDVSGNALLPSNSRSIVKNCAAGDVTTLDRKLRAMEPEPHHRSCRSFDHKFTIDGRQLRQFLLASANLLYAGTSV